MQISAKLTRIHVAPDPFLRMVPAGECLATFGAFPMDAKIMLYPDINPLLGNLQLYSGNIPRAFKAQNLFIKIGVTHQNPPFGDSLYHITTHGKVGRTTISSFEDMIVWQKSMDLVVKIYEICRAGELSKDWGLKDQLQRAAVSIPANIAEGFERGSRKEYHQYITIAKGSAGELRCYIANNCSSWTTE